MILNKVYGLFVAFQFAIHYKQNAFSCDVAKIFELNTSLRAHVLASM